MLLITLTFASRRRSRAIRFVRASTVSEHGGGGRRHPSVQLRARLV